VLSLITHPQWLNPVTATSRDPHSGHFIRLESIEIGNALPRVQIGVPTSSSCRWQARTDFSPSRRDFVHRT
jgi:hypothetical protein